MITVHVLQGPVVAHKGLEELCWGGRLPRGKSLMWMVYRISDQWAGFSWQNSIS